MYQSPAAFLAPLSPRSYCEADEAARESRAVFETTWQLVGLKSSIKENGQYLSEQIGDVPILVRNFEGSIVALRNVCAHRHCSLVSSRLGQSDKLKCPYHGWEYGADGRTRKIPAARNFPAFDRERFRLTSFPVEFCGDLIFVKLTGEGPCLREWMGSLYEKIEAWTTLPDWKLTVVRSLPLPANWKIPVEASLESYHIPEVHPTSFGEDPGEENSEHSFGQYSSSFATSFSNSRLVDRMLKRYEIMLLRILGVNFVGRYEHHHVFPNLLISHTDSLNLVQAIRPVTATTSVSEVWQFGRQSRRANPVSRLTASLWGRVTGWLSYQVLKEDIRIFPQVQRGESGATDCSILGRCEERLNAFQKFIVEQYRSAGSGQKEVLKSSGVGDCSEVESCVAQSKETR